jgi:hypothetical protein
LDHGIGDAAERRCDLWSCLRLEETADTLVLLPEYLGDVAMSINKNQKSIHETRKEREHEDFDGVDFT